MSWYNHEIIHDLQRLSIQADGRPIHDDFVKCHDLADTGKHFFTSIRIVDISNQFLSLIKDASDLILSSAVQLPITPFFPCEANLMSELTHNSPVAAAGNRNQRTRFGYAEAAVNWNQQYMQELEKLADKETDDVFKDGTTDRKV
jgi:hypothetical protein